MKITLKATNTTLTPSIRNSVADKLAGLAKFLKPENKVHVELEVNKRHKSGQLYRVEVTVTPHNHFADARGNDFYEALDLAIPKIKEQFAKSKDKKISDRRKLGAKNKEM